MKIRVIGTGSDFCRHPLVTASFLIQTDVSNVVVGCGHSVPAKLESISLCAEKVDMWIATSSEIGHTAGLLEVAHISKSKPFLVGPPSVIADIAEMFDRYSKKPLHQAFDVKAVSKVTLSEEHYSERIAFFRHLGISTGYSMWLEDSRILVSGNTPMNEEFLHQHGSDANLILHQEVPDLDQLPMYLQKKVWLYGYSNDYNSLEDPIPMLRLPQGSCVFDSARKDKYFEKARFIREAAKRVAGNQVSSAV